MSALPDELLGLSKDELDEVLCRAHPGVWAERKRGFVNAPFHWEWYDLMDEPRVCCIAPREHAKTECWTINQTAWRSIYQPGTWTYIFSQTKEQGEGFLERIDIAVEQAAPELTARMGVDTKTTSRYANGSKVSIAGAGKAVRSAHPDVIIADDILSEEGSRSEYQRQKTSNWFFGTVSNMAHPGTIRTLKGGRQVWMPRTKVHVIGTPFHQSDLLLGMRSNTMYRFRRYAAEFDPEARVAGTWAVEVG